MVSMPTVILCACGWHGDAGEAFEHHKAESHLVPRLDWTFHHPKATTYHIGYLGCLLTDTVPEGAREQVNKNYPFGGWRPFGQNEWKLDADRRILRYPGDPPLQAIASTKLRDERIMIFTSDIWAVVQPDGSFEVARLD